MRSPSCLWPLLLLLLLIAACASRGPAREAEAQPTLAELQVVEPDRICLRLIWSRDLDLVQGALDRVRAGEDFVTVARELGSQRPDQVKDQTSCAQAAEMEAELVAAARELDLGGVAGPLAVGSGWAAVRRTSDAYARRGRELAEAQLPEDAAQAFIRDLTLNPDNVTSWHYLALARQASGDLPGALEALERGLAWRPEDPALLNDQGSILSRLGRDQEAVAAYRRALAQAPGQPLILNNLAWGVLTTGGDLAEAQRLAEAATASRPRQAAFWDTLGSIQAARGRHAAAVLSLHRALALGLEDPRLEERILASLRQVKPEEMARLEADRQAVAAGASPASREQGDETLRPDRGPAYFGAPAGKWEGYSRPLQVEKQAPTAEAPRDGETAARPEDDRQPAGEPSGEEPAEESPPPETAEDMGPRPGPPPSPLPGQAREGEAGSGAGVARPQPPAHQPPPPLPPDEPGPPPRHLTVDGAIAWSQGRVPVETTAPALPAPPQGAEASPAPEAAAPTGETAATPPPAPAQESPAPANQETQAQAWPRDEARLLGPEAAPARVIYPQGDPAPAGPAAAPDPAWLREEEALAGDRDAAPAATTQADAVDEAAPTTAPPEPAAPAEEASAGGQAGPPSQPPAAPAAVTQAPQPPADAAPATAAADQAEPAGSPAATVWPRDEKTLVGSPARVVPARAPSPAPGAPTGQTGGDWLQSEADLLARAAPPAPAPAQPAPPATPAPAAAMPAAPAPPTGPALAPGASGYYIQVSRHQTLAQATRARGTWQELGFPVVLEHVRLPGRQGSWFKVLLGPFKTQALAQGLAGQLVSEGAVKDFAIEQKP